MESVEGPTRMRVGPLCWCLGTYDFSSFLYQRLLCDKLGVCPEGAKFSVEQDSDFMATEADTMIHNLPHRQLMKHAVFVHDTNLRIGFSREEVGSTLDRNGSDSTHGHEVVVFDVVKLLFQERNRSVSLCDVHGVVETLQRPDDCNDCVVHK